MRLIRPTEIQFTARVSEAEIRDRLTTEVMTEIGALDDTGTPHTGVTASVRRGEGRQGGYTIIVSGPAPARLLLPRKGADQ